MPLQSEKLTYEKRARCSQQSRFCPKEVSGHFSDFRSCGDFSTSSFRNFHSFCQSREIFGLHDPHLRYLKCQMMSSERPAKRVRQACEPCRQVYLYPSHVLVKLTGLSRKKSKCPGDRPICSHCSRLRQECFYADDRQNERTLSMTPTPQSRPSSSTTDSRLVGPHSIQFHYNLYIDGVLGGSSEIC